MLAPYRVSVIICAYTEKRWNDLLSSIESIKTQTFTPDELIVVIDHNRELFDRVKDVMPNLCVIENKEEKGLSGARNSGISIAKGEIVAFMDEDAVADNFWLENLITSYREPDVMGVGGLIKPLWDDHKPVWFPEEFNWVVGCTYVGLSEKRAVIRNLIGCNMSFRKEVFDHVGMFQSGIGRIGILPYGCEETELCIRANQKFPERKFIYEPLASVVHRVPTQRGSIHYYISRCYAEGVSKALITNLIGRQDGLSSERTYTLVTLPKGVVRGFGDVIKKLDWSGLGRAVAIMVGFSCTVFGYLLKKITLLVSSGIRPVDRQSLKSA